MIGQFALRLVCGAALFWALLPRPRITSGFFRVQMLVALGLLVLAALTTGRVLALDETAAPLLDGDAAWIPCALLAATAYVGSVLWMLERRGAGTICLFLLLGGSWATLLATQRPAAELATAEGLFFVLSESAAAAVVGGAVTAMLLGHWYLTATGMPLDPLHRANALLGGAILVRGVLAAIGLYFAWPDVRTGTQTLWLVLRWVAGIGGPIAGVWMVRRILAYRNTQSATGVLFAIVILVFIGELSATLLGRELRASL